MPLTRTQSRLSIAVLLLLLIVLSRLLMLDNLEFATDEIWSIWSAEGTISDTLARVPFDWPPLYALLIWAWRSTMGIQPFIMRLSSIFLALISYAILFRVARTVSKKDAGAWLVFLAYASFGYSITLSIFVRGYALMMPIFSLALWYLVRYFRSFKLWDAAGLALMMAALFYTNLTAVFSFVALGIFSLAIASTKQIWRWWLPGLIALLLALPEAINKLGLASRRDVGSPFIKATLFDSLQALYADFFGDFCLVWLALIGLALLWYLLRDRQKSWMILLFFVWGFGLALVMYFLDSVLGFFTPRQMWWLLPGISLLIGFSLIKLPNTIIIAIGLLMTILMFISPTKPMSRHPFEAYLPELRDYIEAGDVVLIDPNCNCGEAMRWEYYLQAYFPDGLTFVDEVGDHQRIWYISFDGQQVEKIFEDVREGRIAGKFFGPPNFLFRLYQSAPDEEGILFENGMRFHGVEILDNMTTAHFPILRHEGELLRVRLWWTVDKPQTADYSISLQGLGRDGLILQSDDAPQLVQLDPTNPQIPARNTSTWQMGQYYVEERDLFVPNPTVTGQYEVYLIVYQWWDAVRIEAPQTNKDAMLPLFNFNVMSW